MSNTSVRVATSSDSAAMLDIYAHYIHNSIATFEEVVPSVEDFRGRVAEVLPVYPWLVAELDGKIIGYAYGHQHSPRAGYRWTAEVSVYVSKDHHRKGIGLSLYGRLIELLREQGFYNLLAIISPPNPGSEALHAQFGFEKAGTYQGIGYKFGAWQTTCWWQLKLREADNQPVPPTPFAEMTLS